MEYSVIWTHEADLFHDICPEKRGINLQTLESVILLAVEIARGDRLDNNAHAQVASPPAAKTQASLPASPARGGEKVLPVVRM